MRREAEPSRSLYALFQNRIYPLYHPGYQKLETTFYFFAKVVVQYEPSAGHNIRDIVQFMMLTCALVPMC